MADVEFRTDNIYEDGIKKSFPFSKYHLKEHAKTVAEEKVKSIFSDDVKTIRYHPLKFTVDDDKSFYSTVSIVVNEDISLTLENYSILPDEMFEDIMNQIQQYIK